MKYKTKPIDYSGCDPVIAKHLKCGEAVLCKTDSGDLYVTAYDGSPTDFQYLTDSYRWVWKATPIKVKTKLKKASEIVKWLEDNGWKFDSDWNRWIDESGDTVCNVSLFRFCGKEYPSRAGSPYYVHPDWVEEVVE